jgi:hypothetical protein
MVVPILGGSPTIPTPCVLCGGNLANPKHAHVYVDVDMLRFYELLSKAMLQNGCVQVDTDTGDIYWSHPRLKEGYAWTPLYVGEVPEAATESA